MVKMIKEKLITLAKMAVHKPKKNRFVELDFLRGFAITFMILLHILWDLDYFDIYSLNNTIYQSSIIAQVMFFTLMGACLAVVYNKNQKSSKIKLYLHLIKRGIWIISLGMIITLVTLIFMPERPILFGVLHCIGLCVILSILFLKLKHWNIAIAITMICTGFVLSTIHTPNPSALHLIIGLHPADFWIYTIDYFPIFPWLGVCLLGVSIGNMLYDGDKRRFKLPDISTYKPVKALSWLGQHSLAIYLVHQPVIAGALTLYTIL